MPLVLFLSLLRTTSCVPTASPAPVPADELAALLDSTTINGKPVPQAAIAGGFRLYHDFECDGTKYSVDSVRHWQLYENDGEHGYCDYTPTVRPGARDLVLQSPQSSDGKIICVPTLISDNLGVVACGQFASRIYVASQVEEDCSTLD